MIFRKILIANRGEIAVRIIAAARAMGISPIAVFSEADAGALHVRLADESRCIGPAPPSQSYLNIQAIVEAAVATGADAIHPGYGFLSENAELAAAVRAAGIKFIGPRPETMELMSDKVAARAAASAAGIPVLPGSEGALDNVGTALKAAAQIGFPVAVKANFGGGGRGMRVVADSASLEAAMNAARREAGTAFGRSEIFLERFLLRPRHVEVQILGDETRHVVHLGDRDCSVQRRHQKVVEEAPAPNLDPDLRSAIHEAALSLARAVAYESAGTVEFLVEPDLNSFFFLEMNPRLQVEHGVTELVTGVDIVEAQIRIAAGQQLGFGQDAVKMNGHAIQARITAEDPWDDFRPTPGRIEDVNVPLSPWIRADFGIESGDRIEPYYDSLIGKLLAWGPDRISATRRLSLALVRLEVSGVPTTARYIAGLLEQPDFIACRHFTGSLEQDWVPDPLERPDSPPRADKKAVEGIIMSERQVMIPGSPPRHLALFGVARTNAPDSMPSARPKHGLAAVGDGRKAGSERKSVHAPMDGMLVESRVAIGQSVAEGEALLVLEAMKMEVVVSAPLAGRVRRVHGEAGAPVRKGQILVEFE